jgi:hypothetical protein
MCRAKRNQSSRAGAFADADADDHDSPNFERGFYYLDLTDPIGFSGNTTITVQDVPVPATALLMAMGLGLVGFARRRRLL